jgi:SRSO17 transposase
MGLSGWACLELADLEAAEYNETRPWHGWHRRVSLVMLALVVLALAMLVAIRRAANTLAPPESTPRMIRGTHR